MRGCPWEGTARHGTGRARLSGHQPLAEDADESAVPATPAADNCPARHSPLAQPSRGGHSRRQHRHLTDPGRLGQGWSRSAGSGCSSADTALGFTAPTSSASAPSACARTAAPAQLQHPITSPHSSGGSRHCPPSEGSPGEQAPSLTMIMRADPHCTGSKQGRTLPSHPQALPAPQHTLGCLTAAIKPSPRQIPP